MSAPTFDRAKVEEAVRQHLRRLRVPFLPIRWVEDAASGYAVTKRAFENAAWLASAEAREGVAWRAAERAAWSVDESDAWGTAWRAAWRAAERAIKSAADSDVENVAENAAENAAESAAWRDAYPWSAASSAAWGTAWSAAERAVWPKGDGPKALKNYVRAWLPLVDAYEAGLWAYWITEDEVVLVPRPRIHLEGNVLHRSDGPAVWWPDSDERYYFLRGVQVPGELVENRKDLTVERIAEEFDAEVRRALMETYYQAAET